MLNITNGSAINDAVCIDTADFGHAIATSGLPKSERVEKWLIRHEKFINGVCSKWIKSFNDPSWQLDDLIQEARLIVWKTWDTYDTNMVGVLSRSYFQACIENHFIELLRKFKAQKRCVYRDIVSLNMTDSYTVIEEFDDWYNGEDLGRNVRIPRLFLPGRDRRGG